MRTPENIDGFYFQQGYNYAESTPDGSVKLGGGCQASSLLIALRLFEGNKYLTMDNISMAADRLGLAFHDKEYATRISYASIPLIAAFALPRSDVRFNHTMTTEEISKFPPTTFYGNEANRLYVNMPRISNLTSLFGISTSEQVADIRKSLRSGGIAIPLVHPNTLYSSDDPETASFLHVVVVSEYNDATDCVRVIDPSPGFSHMPAFKRLRGEGRLKIRANTIRDIQSVNQVARKFHPLKSIDYFIPVKKLEESLRSVSTIIEPSKNN